MPTASIRFLFPRIVAMTPMWRWQGRQLNTISDCVDAVLREFLPCYEPGGIILGGDPRTTEMCQKFSEENGLDYQIVMQGIRLLAAIHTNDTTLFPLTILALQKAAIDLLAKLPRPVCVEELDMKNRVFLEEIAEHIRRSTFKETLSVAYSASVVGTNEKHMAKFNDPLLSLLMNRMLGRLAIPSPGDSPITIEGTFLDILF